MASYGIADIRNVVLIGHGGSGKTSLAEAMMFKAGATRRLGKVTDKTSHLDFADDEREKGYSIDSALGYLTYDKKRINLIDTPGGTGFEGQSISALAGADLAICVISAKEGIQVNTRKMMERAQAYGLARMIVINKIDVEGARPKELVDLIRESFGMECVCANLPANQGRAVVDCFKNNTGSVDFGDVGQSHEKVIEAIVSVDDNLMEKYLGGGLQEADIQSISGKAVSAGMLIPILFTNAHDDIGITELLDTIVTFGPSPIDAKKRVLKDEGKEQPIELQQDGPFVGLVFKITSDPKSNIKYSVVRSLTGTIKADTNFTTQHERRGVKAGHLHQFLGSDHVEVNDIPAGDIFAVAKLDLNYGEVMTTGPAGVVELPATPIPMFSLAIEPQARGDADKISGALRKFTEEDPCFTADRDASTAELVIHGMSDLHLRTVLNRMDRQFKLKVNTHVPRIPYRETVTKKVVDVDYTHKKQTGGAGQYAKVVIGIDPAGRGEGYEFVDDIFGGAIDQQFRPAVDKGVRAQMAEGVLAGYPVVDLKVHLTDGKTHPVDSKDIAFQIAGRQAFKEAFARAKPILLEPIVNVEVTVPNANVGDIQGDMAARRGRPIGQDMLPGGFSVIKALVPLAELATYGSQLSSITGGQGSFSMELSHYDPVPSNVQQQIIDSAKKHKEQDAER